jgi:hypothetical protein
MVDKVGRVIWEKRLYDISLPASLSNKFPRLKEGYLRWAPYMEREPYPGYEVEGFLGWETVKWNIDIGVFPQGKNSIVFIPVLYYQEEENHERVFLKEPVDINGERYIIELRVVPYGKAVDDITGMRYININSRGIPQPCFVDLFKKRKDLLNSDSLVIEARGMDSTMGASWITPEFNTYLFKQLDTSSKKYAKCFAENTLKSFYALLDVGYVHTRPNKDNMLLTGGLTNLEYIINTLDINHLDDSSKKKVRGSIKFSIEEFISSLCNVLLNSRSSEEDSEKWNKVAINILNEEIKEKLDLNQKLKNLYDFKNLTKEIINKYLNYVFKD